MSAGAGEAAGVRLIIFDLDGTLVDSAPAIRDIAATLLRELGLAPLSLEKTRAFIGEGAGVFIARALAARGAAQQDGAALARHVARFEDLYAQAPGAANRPYDGAEAALRKLRAAGFKLGLCTNKPEAPARNLLAALGWDGLFDALVAGDSLPVRKPDPAMPRRILDALGARAALYVGDSETDVATARAAGLAMALHAHGYRKSPLAQMEAEFVFEDFDALTRFALEWAAGR